MNIAHRDLKAENIFIANVGNEKLMKIGDFGFSKSADDHLLTQLGTKCFFPPEIQDRFGEYSLKADIWTLGCLFYACSTGTFPFHHTYIGSLSQQIREAAVDYFRPQFFNVSIIFRVRSQILPVCRLCRARLTCNNSLRTCCKWIQASVQV